MATARSASPVKVEEMCPDSPADLLSLRSASNPLPRTLEEARCPLCWEVVPELLALPCSSHSACLLCFQRTVERGSPRCCPLCRLRGSSLAHRRSDGDVGKGTSEPWDPARRSYPERCWSRSERKTCDPRRESSILLSHGSFSEEMLSNQQAKVKVKTVLSDSENEEPVGTRTQNVLGSLRRSKTTPSAFREASQRSLSCTASLEDRGTLKTRPQPTRTSLARTRHSFTAGILLSSENSPAARRFVWRSLMTSSTPLAAPPTSLMTSPTPLAPPPRQERSISPESNDSISEELNHFKPIVCSPCTPPKRLADGRLLEPTIVKSTPRNLLRGVQSATSYEASPAVMHKWRQIELDRQSVKVTSKATLTSPVSEELVRSTSGEGRTRSGSAGEEERCGVAKGTTQPSGEAAERELMLNKRRLMFEPSPGETDVYKKPLVQICVPALRYNSEGLVTADSASCSGSRSFPSYTRISAVHHSGAHGCQEPSGAEKESYGGGCPQDDPTTGRGKRSQKTKHLDVKRARVLVPPTPGASRRDGEDRVLLRLHTQFGSEKQTLGRPRPGAARYLLRSGVVRDNHRRQSPRKANRVSRKY